MAEVLSASVVFPLLNFALKAGQAGYDLAGVQAAATDHLKTISQVLLDIETAKKLRKQILTCLSDDEVKVVVIVIKNTEEALEQLESLVERARVDMMLKGNTVRAPARIMWVIRDSGMANAALSRLSLTSQSLHSQVNMMRQIQCMPGYNSPIRQSLSPVLPSSPSSSSISSSSSHLKDTTKALGEHREWIKRRYSIRSGSSSPSHTRQTSYDLPRAEENDAFFSVRQNVADWIRDNESVLSDMDPGVYAGPRNELVHARAIGNDDDFSDYPTTHAELEADSIIMPTFQPLSHAATVPSTPSFSSAGQLTGSYNDIRRPHTTLPVITSSTENGTQRPQRRPPSSKNPSRVSHSTCAGTNARSMTTQTPGRQGERILTWVEPMLEEEEEEEPVSQQLRTHQRAPDEPPPYSPSNVHLSPPLARTGASNAADLRGRRPPRIHNIVRSPATGQTNIHPTTPDFSNVVPTARSGTVRCHRSRPSRSERALAEHESEAASIINGQRHSQ